MSKAPTSETHADRDPVSAAAKVLSVLQLVVPLSVPGSGVPRAASCHSWLVGRRFPEFLAAAPAWNLVRKAEGVTPGIEAA